MTGGGSVGRVRVRRALLSVADKSGVTELAECLGRHGVEIVSTGGTAAALIDAGFDVTQVADVTGMGETLGGRVKTLHPAVLGGILHDRDVAAQEGELEALGGRPIDLVVVNFYRFEDAASSGKPMPELVESIDIGGPTMVRSAAKNHRHVAVVVDPGDYPGVIKSLDEGDGHLGRDEMTRLAAKAFARTSEYDASIRDALSGDGDDGPRVPAAMAGARPLRYGENPHQAGVVHAGGGGIRQLGGPPLSYNNIQDAAFAWRAVAEHDGPACAIIKHAIPCGLAVAGTLAEAYSDALRSDPSSAYGGVVACNRELDSPTLELMRKIFLEVIVCPEFDKDITDSLKSSKRMRSVYGPLGVGDGPEGRSLGGISLFQQRDDRKVEATGLEIVSAKKPSPSTLDSLLFAWRVVKHTRSNAIVLAKDTMTIGIGAGQTSRVDAAEIAVARAVARGHVARGSVAASDAFFPFPDGVETLAKAGVVAIVQPGGSKRDAEAVEMADRHGVAMAFTGVRHFSH